MKTLFKQLFSLATGSLVRVFFAYKNFDLLG
jgi:hypothetical protein